MHAKSYQSAKVSLIFNFAPIFRLAQKIVYCSINLYSLLVRYIFFSVSQAALDTMIEHRLFYVVRIRWRVASKIKRATTSCTKAYGARQILLRYSVDCWNSKLSELEGHDLVAQQDDNSVPQQAERLQLLLASGPLLPRVSELLLPDAVALPLCRLRAAISLLRSKSSRVRKLGCLLVCLRASFSSSSSTLRTARSSERRS